MSSGLVKIAATAVLRLSGVVLQTLVLIFVGRLAGPAGVGALQVFLTWTVTLGEGAAAGLPTQSMRKMATLENSRSTAKQFLKAAVKRLVFVWLGVGFLLCVGSLLGMQIAPVELALIAISALCFAFYRTLSEGLKAFRDVNFSVFTESSLPPLVAGVMLLLLLSFGYPADVINVIGCYALGYAITAIVMVLRMAVKLGVTKSSAPVVIAWRDHGPFWVSSLVAIVFLNYPFFVMPYYAELEQVGSFALAYKLLNIGTTILLLLGAIFGPKFSRLAERQDFSAARRLLKQSQKLSLAAFIPLGLSLLVFFPVIHPIFGEGFDTGFSFLLILLVGQLCNAATGLSGQFLNMTGAGDTEMKIQVVAVLVALALTPLAGNLVGGSGIACVYSLTVAVRSFCSLYFAEQALNPGAMRLA